MEQLLQPMQLLVQIMQQQQREGAELMVDVDRDDPAAAPAIPGRRAQARAGPGNRKSKDH